MKQDLAGCLMVVAVLCVGCAVMAGARRRSRRQAVEAERQAVEGRWPAGTLDSTFGKGGKVTVAFPAENAGSTGAEVHAARSNSPRATWRWRRRRAARSSSRGRPRSSATSPTASSTPSFGDGGVVTVPRPPGAVFVLAGVAVDSYGRVVLAGLTRPLPTNSTPDPLLSSAAVMRFNADGTPDPSFGSGGMVITNFGLGAPKAAGGPTSAPRSASATSSSTRRTARS